MCLGVRRVFLSSFVSFLATYAAIQASDAELTSLVFFRGGPSSLYGNLGASDGWMTEFMEKKTGGH